MDRFSQSLNCSFEVKNSGSSTRARLKASTAHLAALSYDSAIFGPAPPAALWCAPRAPPSGSQAMAQ